ncbi:hypothetical protein BGX38DRAFT_1141986 [Terfezia claveryi]|nr:hypothetical protein BGX38DRAFT_1141986 [Terfezia claveryi]
MHNQRPLLPLYETSEEFLDEVPELEITSSSPPDSISSLSSVVIDQNHNSCPRATQPTAPLEKKHVKFAEIDVENIHIYQPSDWGGEIDSHHHYPENFPHRATYGTINPPSILREPTSAFPVKMSTEESLYDHANHVTPMESRKPRARIPLRTGFTPMETTGRQKISPGVCLSASSLTMFVLFLWFLSGGDFSEHKHKDFEFGEDINTNI